MNAPGYAAILNLRSPSRAGFGEEASDKIIYLPIRKRERYAAPHALARLLKEGREYLQWETVTYLMTEAAAITVVILTLLRVLKLTQ